MFKSHLVQILPHDNYLCQVAQSFVQSSSISKAGDSITILGNLFPCLTTLVVQPPPPQHFHYTSLEFPLSCKFQPLSLDYLLYASKKSVALSFLTSPNW